MGRIDVPSLISEVKEREQKVPSTEYYCEEDSGEEYIMDTTQDEHDGIKTKSFTMPQPGRDKMIRHVPGGQDIVGDLKKNK